MVLDTFRLLVFVTVVDRNGYSAAARYLHLSQPTISHHIGELQKGLGAELLRYDHRRVNLTPAGCEVYRAAVAMLSEEDRLGEALNDLRMGRSGRVRVGASIAFEQKYFIEQVIAPFCHSNSETLLSLRFGHSRSQAQSVLDQDLDLAYVIRWHLPTGACFEPLHQATLTFLASKDHPLASKQLVGIDEIASAGLITAPLTHVEASYYSQVLRECGLSEDDSVLEVDGMQARILAAEEGLGVIATFFPPYARRDATGPLVPLRVEAPLPEVEIGIVQLENSPSSKTIDPFADWLRKLVPR